MFEYIKYRYLLWKLRCGRKKLKSEYDNHIAEAENKEKKESLIADEMTFLQLEDQNIGELHTKYLRDMAKTLMVPLPNSEDESLWDRDGYTAPILTEKGIYELNKSIRLEKKEKRDVIFSWLTIIIGLIGALIGLAAVIRK